VLGPAIVGAVAILWARRRFGVAGAARGAGARIAAGAA
jgi:hypothetical protein